MNRGTLLLLLAVWGAATLPVLSAAPPAAVATTIELRGPVTWKQAEGPWYAAYQDQRNRLQDHVKTGADSVATLEFDVGGRVGVNANTEIILVGSREVEAVNQGTLQTLVLTAGSIWARFSGQKQELQVQTSGGVMGIKGTEFVVEADEGQGTTLTVLEGAVELRPVTGDLVLAVPGSRVRFLAGQAPLLEKVEDLKKLRSELEGRFKHFQETLGPMLSEVRGYVPMAARTREVVLDVAAEARATAQAGAETARAGAETARAGVETARESQRTALETLRSLGIQRGGADPPPPPPRRRDFPSGLVPDRTSLGSARPTFQWEPVEGAVTYGVVVARSDSMLEPVWTAKSAVPTVAYPADAQPLVPGSYVWRVIPFDAQGRPAGRASQATFESAGW